MQASGPFRTLRVLLLAGIVAAAPLLLAQAANSPPAPSTAQRAASTTPLAIIPLDNTEGGPSVTGALQVTGSRAVIAASGSITSGTRTTDVALPRRGTLRVCASTTVKLAADSSSTAGDSPSLLMAMDAGAVEMSFATAHTADILLTPDFRILIGGPGAAEVKVRLGSGGDTCIDNPGANAPYVVVSSLFDTGLYRVQAGQRVMFQHGDLHQVVDQEKEPCGCPPDAAKTTGNEFPLAQSEGLAPTPPPAPTPKQPEGIDQVAPPLVYTSPAAATQTAQIPEPGNAQTQTAITSAPTPASAAKKKNPTIFTRFGRFLKRIFGSE